MGTSLTPYRSLVLMDEGGVADVTAHEQLLDILRKCGDLSLIGNIKKVVALQNDSLERSFMFYANSLLEKT